MKKILNNKKRIFINTILMTSTSFLEKIIFLLINIILTRYLSIEDFANYASALSFATFFSVFTNIGISNALIRAVNIEPINEKEHLGNTFFIKTVVSFAVYFIMLLPLYYIYDYSVNTIYLILILGIVRIGNEYLSTFYAFYNAKERFFFICFFTNLFSITFLIGTYAVTHLNGNYFHIANIRFATVLTFIVIIGFLTFKKFKIKLNFSLLPKFVKSAIPFAITTIFDNFILRANIMVLGYLYKEKYNGFFNNGYIFIPAFCIIPMNFSRVLIPFLYKIDYKNDKEKYKFTFNIFTKFLQILAFYITTTILLFGQDIIPLIFGSKYIPSINILKISSLLIPFVFSISYIIIISLEKQKLLMVIQALVAFINIIACFILGIFFKAKGIAYAMVGTYFIQFSLTNYYLIHRGITSFATLLEIFVKLIFVSTINYFLIITFLPNINYIIQFIIFSLCYLLMILFFIVNKTDIRVLKEAIGLKK